MTDPNGGNHWNQLRQLLPAYRAITRVQLGNGRSTSFWWDNWTDGMTLARRFECLISHCSIPDISVAEALLLGVQSTLVTRLSNSAPSELQLLLQLLQEMQLHQLHSSMPDSRTSIFSDTNNNLQPADIYRTSNTDSDLHVFQGSFFRDRVCARFSLRGRATRYTSLTRTRRRRAA
jgi:hypothetical protein